MCVCGCVGVCAHVCVCGVNNLVSTNKPRQDDLCACVCVSMHTHTSMCRLNSSHRPDVTLIDALIDATRQSVTELNELTECGVRVSMCVCKTDEESYIVSILLSLFISNMENRCN